MCGFRRDVPRVLPGYRAYVHASYSESLPLAIIEAMGAGLPVVSSDAGGVPELFQEPEHGRFWPIEDPQRGAEILIDLLESEPEVQRAGRAALEKFRSDYDAEVVAPRLVSFLRSAPRMQARPRDRREVRGSSEVKKVEGETEVSKPNNRRPGVLLDRDGTIINDRGYVGSVDRSSCSTGRPRPSQRSTRPTCRSPW